jgi:hypothetical protein
MCNRVVIIGEYYLRYTMIHLAILRRNAHAAPLFGTLSLGSCQQSECIFQRLVPQRLPN